MAIQKYADEVMADGPIGYWRLGDLPVSPGQTQTAADASGNGNNGTCSGGITFGQPGFHGGDTAALFDGQTGRIIVPNSNSFHPPHITMEAKVRWDGPNPTHPGIRGRILEKSAYPQQAEYGFGILPNGYVTVDIRTSPATTSVSLDSSDPVTQGVETHIAATYDGQHIRIYRNGKPNGEKSAPGAIVAKPYTPLNVTQSGVGIGNQTERDRPFNGLIDEVALYPTALSAERIFAHYRAQFSETFQYAAKFVCGKSPGEVVAPGVYFTAINVHNPTYAPIALRAKVAIALPGLRPGLVSKFHDARLGPDEALEIDCPDIFNPEIFKFREPMQADFLKGFVMIESEVELDVVAVYTALGREKLVETLHTERVPARRMSSGSHEV